MVGAEVELTSRGFAKLEWTISFDGRSKMAGAVATGDRQRRATRKHPRAGGLASRNRRAQREIDAVALADVTRRRYAGV